VSVLVMDCTITGALLPTRTPMIVAVTVFLRWIWAMFNAYFKLWVGKEREPDVIPNDHFPQLVLAGLCLAGQPRAVVPTQRSGAKS
jgi:hypothetical protein